MLRQPRGARASTDLVAAKNRAGHRRRAVWFRRLQALYPDVWAATLMPYSGTNNFNQRKKTFVAALPDDAATQAGFLSLFDTRVNFFGRCFDSDSARRAILARVQQAPRRPHRLSPQSGAAAQTGREALGPALERVQESLQEWLIAAQFLVLILALADGAGGDGRAGSGAGR